MPSEQKIYQPDPKLQQSSYISSMQQYDDLHRESIKRNDNCTLMLFNFLMINSFWNLDPGQFWGNIARQFHWETPADPENFLSYNFDISKGPISIKWMEGASTNVCFNLLDRNIKNGHGDKIAFYWYVLILKFFSNALPTQCFETVKILCVRKKKVLKSWVEFLLFYYWFFPLHFHPRFVEFHSLPRAMQKIVLLTCTTRKCWVWSERDCCWRSVWYSEF